MAFLHYTLFEDRFLEAEMDISGKGRDGTRVGFENASMTNNSGQLLLGPPAYLNANGTSAIEMGELNIPYGSTITFWVEANEGSFNVLSKNNNSLIGLEDRVLTINGQTTSIELEDKTFSLIVVIAKEDKTEVSVNNSPFTTYPVIDLGLGDYKLLDGFKGKISLFTIYDKVLSEVEAGILYSSSFIASKDKAILSKVSRPEEGEDASISTTKDIKAMGVLEFIDATNEDLDASLFDPVIDYTLKNVAPSKEGTYTGRSLRIPVLNDMEDALFLFSTNFKVESGTSIPNLTISFGANISKEYSTFNVGVVKQLYLVFKVPYNSAENISIDWASNSSVSYSNAKLINLTNSGIEDYLYKKNLMPRLEGNKYNIGSEAINWIEGNILNLSFEDNKVISLENLVYIKDENSSSGFVNAFGGLTIASKEIIEFVDF